MALASWRQKLPKIFCHFQLVTDLRPADFENFVAAQIGESFAAASSSAAAWFAAASFAAVAAFPVEKYFVAAFVMASFVVAVELVVATSLAAAFVVVLAAAHPEKIPSLLAQQR